MAPYNREEELKYLDVDNPGDGNGGDSFYGGSNDSFYDDSLVPTRSSCGSSSLSVKDGVVISFVFGLWLYSMMLMFR